MGVPEQVELDGPDRLEIASRLAIATPVARSRAAMNWWIRSPSWVNTSPEDGQPLLLGAFGLGRVLVAPVERLAPPGKTGQAWRAWSHTVMT